jgi:hypothetical protein
MAAEQELGHHGKVVRLVPEVTAWLSTVADIENLWSLQLKRIESLIELKRFDEAEREIRALHLAVMPPVVQVSLQVLNARLQKLKLNGPVPLLEQADTTLSNKPLLKQMFVELIRSAALLASVSIKSPQCHSRRSACGVVRHSLHTGYVRREGER